MSAAWALVDNHEFVSRVASDTLTVDRPLYRGVRAAIRSYDRPARQALRSRTAVDRWLTAHGLLDRIHDVEQALEALAADELPMLDTAAAELRDVPAERVRTALLLLSAAGAGEVARAGAGAGAMAVGAAAGRDAHQLAVAAELACLALAAHEDVLDPAPAGGAPTRSANRFAVSAGDYLLFRSFGLAAQLGSGYVQLMSRASADVCAGTLLRLQGIPEHPGRGAPEDEVARLTTGTLFELPVLLGAALAGPAPGTAARTAAVGRALGLVTAAGRARSHGAEAGGEERWERAVRQLTAACAQLPAGPSADALRTRTGATSAGNSRPLALGCSWDVCAAIHSGASRSGFGGRPARPAGFLR
ncbi:hypothetical protein E5206_11130 [Arthrobacter sp. PAMC25564]|uniref:polyprenyl synthetase family protein n=1 Tax=Arthrobacter sp. PAMC25564 TaxID=2565366 RepID=UPI0010A28B68|nr:polyprenyl synthetase family protein [Arthrobacter sp. PAMC25564]QCB97403.1 hypothetical protein E5206_11130 [Arthrobacter sp. PAMC25564]